MRADCPRSLPSGSCQAPVPYTIQEEHPPARFHDEQRAAQRRRKSRRRRAVLKMHWAIKSSVDSMFLTIGARVSFSEWDDAVSVPELKHRASSASASPEIQSSRVLRWWGS